MELFSFFALLLSGKNTSRVSRFLKENVQPEKHLSLEHGPKVHVISAGAKAHSHNVVRSISPSCSVPRGGGSGCLEALLTTTV